MTARRWRIIRVPVELAARLDRLCRETECAHVEGRITLPNEYCERVPIHHLIERALDEVESRRLRSKAPRKKRTDDSVNLISVDSEQGVYT